MKLLGLLAVLLLSLPSLFADSADLDVRPVADARVLRAGFTYGGLRVSVTNAGPDTAKGVTVFIAAPVHVDCNCDLGDIPPGQNRERFVTFEVPNAAGPLAFTYIVNSNTPDPNPDNNTVTVALPVSTDPDVLLRFFGLPQPLDLGLPFIPAFQLSNFSRSAAHDVDVTLNFPADVGIASLPAGCSSPAAGRIVCHIDTLLPPNGTPNTIVILQPKLIAPASYGSGSFAITATAVEREPDFDPASSTATITATLYKTLYVTTTADSGSGSLRQTILDANAACPAATPCTIGFRIEEPSAMPWKTIRVLSPLPAVAPAIRIEGTTQTGLVGDSNPDGPEIEITGGGTVEGDGLVVPSCGIEIGHLAVNGFRGNGISVVALPRATVCTSFTGTNLHDLFVGTDPTGAEARPNLRGIGTSIIGSTGYTDLGPSTSVSDSVISGNTFSGIFALTGRIIANHNRIGVKAHADEPLPNGNAGIYIGARSYGSHIGSFDGSPSNVIAFNGQMGVAVAAGVGNVNVTGNRIWGNGGLGIDIGLDGPTPSSAAVVPAPVLTLAHYDPVAKQTVIEGDAGVASPYSQVEVELFANDAVDPSGFGEGQQPLGVARLSGNSPIHFRFAVNGDLTGKAITAATTRDYYVGFASVGAEGIGNANLTQTSEFSRPIEVR